MTAEREAQAAREVEVMVGMLLLVDNPDRGRVDMWVVKGIRELKSGRRKLTLVSSTRSCSIEAEATWGDAVIRAPWRLWEPSTKDRAHIYKRLGELAEAATPEGGEDRG